MAVLFLAHSVTGFFIESHSAGRLPCSFICDYHWDHMVPIFDTLGTCVTSVIQ